MSDETPNDTRDTSGRFVKRAAEKAHRLHTPSEDGVHPVAKILFGWTEAKVAGTAIFWGIGLLNTVFREPGAEPDWRFAVGLAVLGLALLDTGLFVRRLLKRRA